MPEETAPEGTFVWSVEGRPIRIRAAADVLASIGRAAREGLEKVPRRGLEVGGLLLGTREGDELTITDWRPISCEHARGPGFELSANDEAALRQLLESLTGDPARSGLQVLGWFHTHTRDGICLTKSDLDVYNRFFPAPWQVALVVKPHAKEPTRAGFFFREPNGAIRAETSYREFVIEPGLRPQPVGFDPASLGGATSPAPAPVRAAEAPSTVRLPEPPPASPARAPRWARSRRRLVVALAGAVLASAAVFVGIPLLAPQPRHAAIALDLRPAGDALVLEWDRSPALLRDATGAALTIEDAGERRLIRLTADEFAAGSLTYYRRSGDVSFQLELVRSTGPPLLGSARFTGAPPAAAAPPEDPAELERLEREIGLLRSELEREAARSRRLRQEIRVIERQLSGAARGR
jgi:proteasome lid subunit RPN8/RPN11